MDYAIVVGISRYPDLGDAPGQAVDLQAPAADAQAVYNWLINAESGGVVPKGNVWLVRTASAETNVNGEGPPQPDHSAVSWPFFCLDQLAAQNLKAGNGRRVGRRLYIYMSGHGFSLNSMQGALFTAEARPTIPVNIFASGWLEFFMDQGYFDEYVLWLDCCMDRGSTALPEVIPSRRTTQAIGAPGMVAFAARRPARAVERPIADDAGNIHGIFTWALLSGLNGAAAGPDGSITSDSLEGYLYNATKKLLTVEDTQNRLISQDPFIYSTPQKLVFRVGVNVPKYPIVFKLSATMEGQEVRVWGGLPPAVTAQGKVAAGTDLSFDLPTGLYVLEVPGAAMRYGFEVTGPATLECTDPANWVHQAVQPPADRDKKFLLFIDPQNPAASILVVDARFGKTMEVPRLLSTTLPFGIYKLKVCLGRETAESIMLLDGETPNPPLNLPKVASASPIDGTALTHETHVAAAAALMAAAPSIPSNDDRREPADGGGESKPIPGSEIHLLARVFGRRRLDAAVGNPWDGVQLLDAQGHVLTDLSVAPVQRPPNSADLDYWVTYRAPVAPGTYFVRQNMSGGHQWDQSLIVPKDWNLGVHLLALSEDSSPDAPPSQPLLRRSVLMSKLGPDLPPMSGPVANSWLETARIALAEERRILTTELEDLLTKKFANPIAGIIGAHLLIFAVDNPKPPSVAEFTLDTLNEVVPNLRLLVGGNTHADVEAISLRCPDEGLRTRMVFTEPPMFERSWRLLVQASQTRPELISKELWGNVHAAAGSGGFFIWASDAAAKAAHLSQLQGLVRDLSLVNTSVAGAASTEQPSTTDVAVAAAAVRQGAAESGGDPRESESPPAADAEVAQPTAQAANTGGGGLDFGAMYHAAVGAVGAVPDLFMQGAGAVVGATQQVVNSALGALGWAGANAYTNTVSGVQAVLATLTSQEVEKAAASVALDLNVPAAAFQTLWQEQIAENTAKMDELTSITVPGTVHISEPGASMVAAPAKAESSRRTRSPRRPKSTAAGASPQPSSGQGAEMELEAPPPKSARRKKH